MGFRLETRVVRIQLRNTEFDGVDVRAEVPPAGPLASALAESDEALFGLFGDHLIQWNIETLDGDPIPADLEGIASLPADLAHSLVLGWVRESKRRQFDRPTAPSSEELNGSAAGTEITAL